MTLSKHLYAILGLVTVLTAVGISAPAVKAAPPGGTQSVLVTNAPNNAAYVRLAPTTPVNLSMTSQFVDGTTAGQNIMYTVPAGKRLILTDVFSLVSLPSGEQVTSLSLRDVIGGTSIVNYMSVSAQSSVNGQDRFASSVNGAEIIVPAGHQVIIHGMRSSVADTGFLQTSINGYLEDAS